MFRKFLAEENGYALVLTLLFLPVFVGVGLLVVDIGRGNNAQSDLQAAADALALAGARELDRQSGAIADAQAAMERVTNSVNFLDISTAGSSIRLNYDDADADGRPFYVAFLRAIPGDIDPTDPTGNKRVPGDDNTPITTEFVNAWATMKDSEARYVVVQARSRDLNPFFFNPATRNSEDVPVAATAVATANAYTCDLAPMYICNFPDLQAALGGTALPHGKLYSLPMNPSQSSEPGNLGFLRTGDLLAQESDFGGSASNGNPGGGTKILMRALAGGSYERCISAQDRVYTQPGASPRALDALNTRFGYYLSNKGDFSSGAEGLYPPAANVRKGWEIDKSAKDCRVPPSNGEKVADINDRLLRNPVMSPNRTPLGKDDDGTTDILWNLNHSAFQTPAGQDLVKTVTGQFLLNGAPYSGEVIEYPPYWPTLKGNKFDYKAVFGRFPSRYEFYQYEIKDAALLALKSTAGTKPAENEIADPKQCFTGTSAVRPGIDRRTMLMAIVDCSTQAINGTKPVATLGLAKVFLTHPATVGATTGSMNVEVYEVIKNFDQKRDTFLRTEAVLVR